MSEPISAAGETSSEHPLVNSVAKLMGQATGLAQSAGVKTAGGLLTAARRTGKLFAISGKLPAMVRRGTEKRQRAKVRHDIEQLRLRMRDLYARIGEGLCKSANAADRASLAADPQVAALVALVRDLDVEIQTLQAHLQRSPTPVPAATQTEAAGVPAEAQDAESEANAVGPSPAAEGPADVISDDE